MSTLPISSCLPESYCTPEQMLFWDANNDVLLWPYRAPTLDSGYPDEQIRLFAYHPDTNQWEERTVTAPRNMQGGALLDGNGDPYRVIGRNGTFDPVQNVMVITGSGAEVGSVPYLYLYRYGDGSGTPPTPDTTAPAAVTNLTAF